MNTRKVYNLNNEDIITYDNSLTAEESVIIAYMQYELKDWNTWDYKSKIEKYKNHLCYGKCTVTMGDYCTFTNKVVYVNGN